MNIILYSLAIILLATSYLKDKAKRKKALKKGWKSFENILPELLVIMLLIGVLLAVVDHELISSLLGESSGWFGVILASIIGAITLIPGFVAFPTAALLLKGGAGYMQIAAFVSTLMMVGIVTLPVEVKYFGKKISYTRNVLAFMFSFIVAIVVGMAVTNL